jgi:transcriptional regulator with XRE-family HTH domain
MNVRKTVRKRVTAGLFDAHHDTLRGLERAYHAAGIAVEFYEMINEKMEKTILLLNSQTRIPYKSVVIEGKSPWQAIRDVVEQVREEYGYESPRCVPFKLREWIIVQMQDKGITETELANKANCSLSFVSHFLSGRRKSDLILENAAKLLGYSTVEELIAASQARTPSPTDDDEPSESFREPLEAPRGYDGGGL